MVATLTDLVADVPRLYLVVVGMALLGMTATVLLAYADRIRRGYRGALNVHVAMIAASYLLILAAGIIVTYDRVGEPYTVRTALLVVGETLGLIALTIILRDLRQRR